MEAKERGSQAYRQGNFQRAIECFTEGILSDPSDASGELKVLYSNRSAAYCQLKNYSKAIEDAEKCISMDESWGKGYSRKGAALMGAGRYTEAYNTYQRGARMDPNNAALAEERDRALSKIQGSSNSASGWYSQTQSPAISNLAYIIFGLNVLSTVSAILSFIPFFGLGRSCYRIFIISSLARYLNSVFEGQGFPKFTSAYLQQVIADPNTPYTLLAVLMLAARPSTMGMVPLLLTQVFHAARFFYPLALRYSPAFAEKLAAETDKALASALSKQDPHWSSRSTAQKWTTIWANVRHMSCVSEVMMGIFLIFELITPARQLMMVVLYWQYLQMRYMIEQSQDNPSEAYLAKAFREVDARILSLTTHQYAPSFLRTGYGYIRNFLQKQAQPPQPGQQRRSCTIM